LELWDEVMGPSEADFDRLSAVAKLRVAVTAIKWTAERLDPPIDDDAAAALVADATAHFESAVAQGNGVVPISSEWNQRIETELDRPTVAGAPSIIMALLYCFATGPELEGVAVYNALGSCYNAVEQEFRGPFTDIDDERGNDRCIETIAYQQHLLQSAL
jgi:hypothetical protein